MRKAFLAILILLSFQKVSAQTDESIISQVISELVDCSSKVDDTLFLDQHISNTFFHDDSILFKKKAGLEVPQKTLAEILSNSKKINNNDKWKEGELNKKKDKLWSLVTLLMNKSQKKSTLAVKEIF